LWLVRVLQKAICHHSSNNSIGKIINQSNLIIINMLSFLCWPGIPTIIISFLVNMWLHFQTLILIALLDVPQITHIFKLAKPKILKDSICPIRMRVAIGRNGVLNSRKNII
jgi:hypothetical protein